MCSGNIFSFNYALIGPEITLIDVSPLSFPVEAKLAFLSPWHLYFAVWFTAIKSLQRRQLFFNMEEVGFILPAAFSGDGLWLS